MTITTTPWNSAEHLKTEEDIQLYLEACFDEAGGDSDALIHALNVIARAKNLGQVDKNSGLTNSNELYQAIAPDSSPTFAMVAKLVNTLGFTALLITVRDSRILSLPCLVESRRVITLCPSLLDPYMILPHHTAPDILGD